VSNRAADSARFGQRFGSKKQLQLYEAAGKLEPTSEYLRSEPAIIAGIAMATLPASTVGRG
jgi:hypothetical protein